MAMAVSAPLATYLMSKFGVKRIYIGSLVLFLVGSMLCGIVLEYQFSDYFPYYSGIQQRYSMPLAMTLIFTNVPPEGRGTAMGIFGIPMVLAPAIGVTLGGYLVEYLDWRWCFYVNVPIVIMAVIISILWIKDTPKDRRFAAGYERICAGCCRFRHSSLRPHLRSELGVGAISALWVYSGSA